jgi:hypothetical protein
MGIFDFLGLGTATAAPIDAIGNIISKVYTTEGEKLSAQEMIERLRQNPQLWTFELNKLNALDLRLFNSGWRPFIGWICGICVGLYYIPQFILAAYLWLVMCLEAHGIVPYPIDPTSLMQLVYLMLGFGAYRCLETVTGKKNG